MTESKIIIKLDKDKKKELEIRFSQIGLSMNDYINFALNQFLIQGKVPFEIKSPSYDIPTLKTKKAMLKTEEEDIGIIKNSISNSDN